MQTQLYLATHDTISFIVYSTVIFFNIESAKKAIYN